MPSMSAGARADAVVVGTRSRAEGLGPSETTGHSGVCGRAVLVVEDEYYIATDVARALRRAGAEVLGPYASEGAARSGMALQRPDAAVVDINLGAGMSFRFSEILLDQGVPIVFLTGYDAEVIPAEFAHVERLEKPVPARRVVSAVARLLVTSL